jgi:multiple sugar transport system permease protein
MSRGSQTIGAPQRKVAAAVIIIPVFIYILFPFFVMISTALKSLNQVYVYPPIIWPSVPIWKNFIDVWDAIPLSNFLFSSMLVAGVSMFITISAAAPAAYALSRFRFPGRKTILQTSLIAQLFSPIIIIVPLFKMFAAARLIDNYFTLIITNAAFNMTFSIWLLTSYFQAIPKDMEEAAFVEGCNHLQVLLKIVGPIAGPGMVTVIIFGFITTWNEFLMALTFITTPTKKMITVGLYQLVGKFEVQWNLLAAGSIFGVLPTLILFMLIQKQLVKGLAVGALKS